MCRALWPLCAPPKDALAVLDLLLPRGGAVPLSYRERQREKAAVTPGIHSHVHPLVTSLIHSTHVYWIPTVREAFC